MNGTAFLVMAIAMVMIWGGLLVSIVHLMRHPDIALEDVKND